MFWSKVRAAVLIIGLGSVVVSSGSAGIISAQEGRKEMPSNVAAQVIKEYGWEANWGERAAWSRRRIRPNVSGYLDMFDLPAKKKIKGTPHKLERYDKPGGTFEQTETFAGKVVMLLQLTPDENRFYKDSFFRLLAPDYAKLYEEFKDRDDLVLAPVWTDASKNMAERREALGAFLKKYKLPGSVYVNAQDFPKKGGGTYAGPAGKGFGPRVEIRDKNGHIVFREHSWLFYYNAYRLMLKRALAPEYDALVRQEFPDQSRHLPQVVQERDGLAYRDDFESYASGFDLKMSPRWGFHYETQHRVDCRAGLTGDKGIGGSKAAWFYADYVRGVHEGTTGSNWRNNLGHDLPVPLRDGHFRFRLNAKSLSKKRGLSELEKELAEYSQYASKRATDLIIMFRRPESVVPSGYLLVKNGTFLLIDENPHIRDIAEKGAVKVKPGTWYEIEVKTKPGNPAEVLVNGKSVGKLQSAALLGVTFRCRPGTNRVGNSLENVSGVNFLLDDVEAFYRGNPEKLVAEHTAYAEASKSVPVGEPTYPSYTEVEKKVFEYDTAHFGLLGRKDLYFHNPRKPNGSLVMERVFKPGTYATLPDDHKGEVIMMHASQELPPAGALRRTFCASAVGEEVRKLTMDDFGGRAQIYNRSAPYGEWCRSGYEELREIRVEQIVAKRAVRKKFGRAVFWEVDECAPEDNQVLTSFADSRFYEFTRIDGSRALWGGGHGSLPPGVGGFILNRQGKFEMKLTGEYMHREGLWTGMKVALDDDFAKSIIRNVAEGSPIVKSRHLPVVSKSAKGLLYREDFESYADGVDLRTAPWWGFSYMLMQPSVRPYHRYRNRMGMGEGRGGSNALLMDNSVPYDRVGDFPWRGMPGYEEKVQPYLMVHMFGQPLKKGTFRFCLRQGPKQHKRGGYAFGQRPAGRGKDGWFAVDLLNEKEEIIDAIITTADKALSWDARLKLEKADAAQASIAIRKWHADKFAGAFPDDKTWHEVKVVVAPGQKVEVFVDGKSIGKLPTETFSGIRLGVWHGETMYVDDVELFCEGDAEKLEKEYTEAMKKDLVRRQAQWEKTARAIINKGGGWRLPRDRRPKPYSGK